MKALGFRAEKNGVYWAIVEGTSEQPKLVAHDYIAAPKDETESAGLAYLRDRIQAVVKLHRPKKAFVRYPEPMRKSGKGITSTDSRLRVEGVILESLHVLGVVVKGGSIVSMTSRMGSKGAKAYMLASEFRGITYPNRDPYTKESIVAAVTAIGKEDDNE